MNFFYIFEGFVTRLYIMILACSMVRLDFNFLSFDLPPEITAVTESTDAIGSSRNFLFGNKVKKITLGLKMEAVYSSETLVSTDKYTRRYNPEGDIDQTEKILQDEILGSHGGEYEDDCSGMLRRVMW
jgi:hypothetical protein